METNSEYKKTNLILLNSTIKLLLSSYLDISTLITFHYLCKKTKLKENHNKIAIMNYLQLNYKPKVIINYNETKYKSFVLDMEIKFKVSITELEKILSVFYQQNNLTEKYVRERSYLYEVIFI
jgi:hypothetical protein